MSGHRRMIEIVLTRLAFVGKREPAAPRTGGTGIFRSLCICGCRAALALHGNGFGPSDAPRQPCAKGAAKRCQGKRQQNACRCTKRRGRRGNDSVDPQRDDQALDQAWADRKTSDAEQGSEPQCDRRRKQRMSRDRLLAACFTWLDLGQSSTPVVVGACSPVRIGRAAVRPFERPDLATFGKRLDNAER